MYWRVQDPVGYLAGVANRLTTKFKTDTILDYCLK